MLTIYPNQRFIVMLSYTIQIIMIFDISMFEVKDIISVLILPAPTININNFKPLTAISWADNLVLFIKNKLFTNVLCMI